VAVTAVLFGQEPTTGLNIAPVYEGWEENPDGSYKLIFGYFNRNWNERIDVPIGTANMIEPGGPDQGQPTHFFPRRSQFVFSVRVPKDFGNRELVWTLTVNGKTEKAYGTLKPDYIVNDTVRHANLGAAGLLATSPDLAGNKPPTLQVEGDRKRRVRVGEPVQLAAVAQDDGRPKVRNMPPSVAATRTLPNSATGLRLAWFKYRGAGDVTFDPPQFSVWEDFREGANSPWAAGWKTPPVPSGNKWDVRATFKAPGEYVLRCLATDGGLSQYEDITVVVAP
jgi:hypothetical protein